MEAGGQGGHFDICPPNILEKESTLYWLLEQLNLRFYGAIDVLPTQILIDFTDPVLKVFFKEFVSTCTG